MDPWWKALVASPEKQAAPAQRFAECSVSDQALEVDFRYRDSNYSPLYGFYQPVKESWLLSCS